jgi:Protein of unknown function (DUF3306)
MTGSKNRSEPFLARWSRLKRKQQEEEDPAESRGRPPGTPAGPAPADANPDPPPQHQGKAPPPPIDLASLPSIDSITAGSDIRAFLESGVPAELTKAALRRAWTSDPAIRDFIGIAENQWDFTDPGAIPGFGPLEANTDVVALVRQALGEIAPPRSPDQGSDPSAAVASKPLAQPYGIPDRNTSDATSEEPVEAQQNAAPAAAQHADPSAVASAAPSRRSHGGARPK